MYTKINLGIESKLRRMTTSELMNQVYSIGNTNEYGTNSDDIPRSHEYITISNGKDIYEALLNAYESTMVLSQHIKVELYEIYDGTRKLFSREIREALDANVKLINTLENFIVYIGEDE